MRKKIASDIAHITIRIREDLRKKLAKAAESEQRSLNSEIALRLEESFKFEAMERQIEAMERQLTRDEKLTENMARVWERLAGMTVQPETEEMFRAAAEDLRKIIPRETPRSTEEKK